MLNWFKLNHLTLKNELKDVHVVNKASTDSPKRGRSNAFTLIILYWRHFQIVAPICLQTPFLGRRGSLALMFFIGGVRWDFLQAQPKPGPNLTR